MSTYYLGLSMAGTVSAGTYTGGCLVELDNWLKTWRKGVRDDKPIKLVAQEDVIEKENGEVIYKKGDIIEILPSEIPKHDVKINTMTGASGGGVSATLYAIGLITGQVEHFLHDIWTGFDIDQMLNNDDITNANARAASILNVLPINNVVNTLRNLKWSVNNLPNIDYITDRLELYQTLSSYEAIPYNLSQFGNNLQEPETFSNHFDYIRFSLSKTNEIRRNTYSDRPYRYDLAIKSGTVLGKDPLWCKMLQSTPATGAFPIGFRPREMDRERKEYYGKMFYLEYSIPGSQVDYIKVDPNWIAGDEAIKMKYFDGGAFDDEPHDLARASLIRYLNEVEGKNLSILPNDGKTAFASIILIDPFPVHKQPVQPGIAVGRIPDLFQQIPLLVSSLLEQGRFHADWIEKTFNEQYYSRFLITPVRPGTQTGVDNMLAGSLFGAFCGFLDSSFREHDYKLGHYNTHQFLNKHLAVPTNNDVVNYCSNISPDTRYKYLALGWLMSENGKEFCQIIPRFIESDKTNSTLPAWPCMAIQRWNEIRQNILTRTKLLSKNLTNIASVWLWLIWILKGKKLVNEMLDKMEDTLTTAHLLVK